MYIFKLFVLAAVAVTAYDGGQASSEEKTYQKKSSPTLNEGIDDFKTCVIVNLKNHSDVAQAFEKCSFTPEGAGRSGKGGIVGGVPSSALILFAIELQLASISECWNKEKKRQPGQELRVSMSFSVDAKGRVQSLEIRDLSAKKHKFFKVCLSKAWSSFSFPVAAGGKSITYPLTFGPD